MISIFPKADDVEFHSSSHKATFGFMVNTLKILTKGASKYNHHKKVFSKSGFQEENGYSTLSLSKTFKGPEDLFEIQKVRDIENLSK